MVFIRRFAIQNPLPIKRVGSSPTIGTIYLVQRENLEKTRPGVVFFYA
jgi:hypothetical protein